MLIQQGPWSYCEGGGGCVSVSKRGAEKYFFSVTLYNFQNSRAGGGGGGVELKPTMPLSLCRPCDEVQAHSQVQAGT